MKWIITGGCGFIGSHFIRHVLASHKKVRILNLDCQTYAGRGRNLAGIEGHPRYQWKKADIASSSVRSEIRSFKPDLIVNFAAESHVDRSVLDASSFIRTNTVGVQNLLEIAREFKVSRFLQVSTDEVYGSIPGRGRASEDWPLVTSSPYSASKAAGDLFALAAFRTHAQDVVITRCTNNYGSFQFPEKLIPLMITHAMNHLPLPVYGDGLQKRDWIHVEDHCRGILAAIEKGRPGEIYNFGCGSEPTNMEIVKTILKILKKPMTLIRHVKDRPGHDRRYAVDTRKAWKELGWKPQIQFQEGLLQTVHWYQAHVDWWKRLTQSA